MQSFNKRQSRKMRLLNFKKLCLGCLLLTVHFYYIFLRCFSLKMRFAGKTRGQKCVLGALSFFQKKERLRAVTDLWVFCWRPELQIGNNSRPSARTMCYRAQAKSQASRGSLNWAFDVSSGVVNFPRGTCVWLRWTFCVWLSWSRALQNAQLARTHTHTESNTQKAYNIREGSSAPAAMLMGTFKKRCSHIRMGEQELFLAAESRIRTRFTSLNLLIL